MGAKRTRWLRQLELAVWIVFAGAVVVATVRLGLAGYQMIAGGDLIMPISVRVPIASIGAVDAPGLATGRLDPATDVTVDIWRPTVQQHLLHLTGWLPSLLLVIVPAYLLARRLRRAGRGELFTVEAVRTLRLIGWIVIAGAIVTVNVTALSDGLLVASVVPGTIAYTLEIPFGWLVTGIGALAAAELLTHGTGMREDLEGVV